MPSLQCSWGIRSSTVRTCCRVKGWAVTKDRRTLGRWLAVHEEGSTFFSLSPTRHPRAQRTGQGHPLPEVLLGPQCGARFLLSAPRESPRAEPAAPWPGAPGTLEGPWGQACRDRTWETAAMGISPFLSLSTHSLALLCDRHVPLSQVGDRWDQGFERIHSGLGSLQWAPHLLERGNQERLQKVRSRWGLEREAGVPWACGKGGPSSWKAPRGLSPGNMSQGSSHLCLGPSAQGRIRPFRPFSVLGGPGSGTCTIFQSLYQAAGPSGQWAP